jgi:hypothetical protein
VACLWSVHMECRRDMKAFLAVAGPLMEMFAR